LIDQIHHDAVFTAFENLLALKLGRRLGHDLPRTQTFFTLSKKSAFARLRSDCCRRLSYAAFLYHLNGLGR
jgi:hypothetical protein